MGQFDVHRPVARRQILVVDVQHGLLEGIAGRVVVPLRPRSATKTVMARLAPVLDVNGESYTVFVGEIASLAIRDLGPVVARLDEAQQDAVKSALDMLFYGF